MAVVFISPKQRQKMFFLIITAAFLLFVAGIFLLVFWAGPKKVSPTLVFNKPKVSVDMSVFDLQQFKNLQPFPDMQMQFSYTAVDKKKKQVTGFIPADSLDQARAILASTGLTVTQIQEAGTGRDDPFVPYYTIAPAPAPTNKKTK